VRVACTAPEEAGWFLLRLSLHDPVMPLNIESEVAGGVDRITQRLRAFLTGFDDLDLGALGPFAAAPAPGGDPPR
jgi:phosphomannomutase